MESCNANTFQFIAKKYVENLAKNCGHFLWSQLNSFPPDGYGYFGDEHPFHTVALAVSHAPKKCNMCT